MTAWPLSILIEIKSFHLLLYRFWLCRRIEPGNSFFHQRIPNTPVKALRRFILMSGSEYPGIRRPYSGAAQSVDRMHHALRARSERFGWSLRNAFIRLTLALRPIAVPLSQDWITVRWVPSYRASSVFVMPSRSRIRSTSCIRGVNCFRSSSCRPGRLQYFETATLFFPACPKSRRKKTKKIYP
jgi:hypothetical protein